MKATHSRFYLGSVSSGTLRSEDLLPAFCDCLKSLGYHGKRGGAYERACRFLRRSNWDLTEDQAEEASELVNDLQDLLNNFAPSYCYFGAHCGDGADFGFWVCGEWRQMAEEDGIPFSEPESAYVGEWFSVSDHGNVTLYVREKGRDREVWSMV